MKKKYIFILATLALVIFVLGAKLATAQRVEIRVGNTLIHFFPLIISTKAAEAPSGVLYVFSSTETTDGNPGGRNAMMDICSTDDAYSHFCSKGEIENAWETQGVYFDSSFQDSWVDNLWNNNNSCVSWTQTTSYQGYFIENNIDDALQLQNSGDCANNYAVACCKQMP